MTNEMILAMNAYDFRNFADTLPTPLMLQGRGVNLTGSTPVRPLPRNPISRFVGGSECVYRTQTGWLYCQLDRD